MQIIRGNLAKKILLIFVIILCIYLFTTTAEIRIFSHDEEKNDYGPTIIPRVKKTRVYDDDTVIARIVRINADTSTETKICYYEIFSLRIIYPDGTVDEKDIKLDIPQFNYCFIQIGTKVVEFLNYHWVKKNCILITYYGATVLNDTYEEWGMIIDLDGNVLDKTLFGLVFIGDQLPDSKLRLNINREKGFLRLAAVGNSSDVKMEWQQYRVEPDGKFKKLTNGTLEFGNPSSLSATILSTIDENYAVVYANTTNNFMATNPLLPQGELYLLPIEYNHSPVHPLLFYQIPLPNLSFPALTCDIPLIGQVCILTVSQKDPAGLQPENIFFVKVNFLSSGSVTNITVINDIIPIISNNNANINSLLFGGYLLTNSFKDNQNSHFIYGYLFGNDDSNSTRWEFSEPKPTNMDEVFQVLHNNTLLVAQMETSNSWQFQVIDLPKFLSDKDNGYFNVNVEATFPEIESSINPYIPKISIDFYDPVELSSGNLSIYQVIDDQYLLRQLIPGVLCSINNDSKTVSADVLESTFSVSEGKYFIKVDNNFVRNKAYKEPLLGIGENVWRFTAKERKDFFSPPTTGLLRLTSIGTQVFDNLSLEERYNFFDTLLEELSFAVPISRKRLTANYKVQLDTSSNENQYLTSIGIGQIRDEHDNSVASVVRLIDIMIKNKDQSPIGSGRATGYLDESFGFIIFLNLWEMYKSRVIGLLIIVVLFVFLSTLAKIRSFYAQKKYGKAQSNNLAIFQLGLIVFDLMVDLIFVFSNASDLPILYIPSVIVFTIPIAINTTSAFYIISQEYARPKFYQWFIRNKRNTINTTIFTALAGADIEALSILQSYIAGFQSFQAPFSDSAKSMVFWVSFLNIFIEDVPQVIIQLYYRDHVVTYDIIPLLTLISSAANLLISIVGKLYQGTGRVKYQNISNYDTPDDMVYFDGLSDSATVVSSYINASNNLMIRIKKTK